MMGSWYNGYLTHVYQRYIRSKIKKIFVSFDINNIKIVSLYFLIQHAALVVHVVHIGQLLAKCAQL